MKRILLVDDDELVLNFLCDAFAREGFEPIRAVNGQEAIDLFRASPADAVVVDLLMPEKEGIETIREIRELSPATGIVAISGGGRLGPAFYLDAAKKVGADFVFRKPVERSVLMDAVKTLTQSREAPADE